MLSEASSTTVPPAFASLREHVSRLGDARFWWPYVAEILERHGLAGRGGEPVAGVGGTYPTFVCGEVVVKLFGYSRSWRESHAAERAAHVVVASDPAIAAPRLLAEGRLCDDADAPWPYLVTTRTSGVAWEHAGLDAHQKRAVAAELGRQVRRVHALRPSPDVATHESWSTSGVTAAAARSSLPAHLVAQVDGYLAGLGPLERVFVHGDLMHRHVFVEDGRLAGIIDWGDAMVTDPHYELAKLHLDLFDCDAVLLRVFLESSRWHVTDDFARRSMGLALCRQAHGLAQHHTMDVFYKLPALTPLREIATLEELANELFAV
jgi:hygromycin-B 7''-O-kinase